MVEVRVYEKSESKELRVSKTFFLHESLVIPRALAFKSNGTIVRPGDGIFSIKAPISTFKDFVGWVYGSKLDAQAANKVPSLWRFSTQFCIPLGNDLLEWCHKYCCTEKDQLSLLQLLISEEVCCMSRLPDYLLECLAFQIVSKGWIQVIEASAGEWERFVNMRGSDGPIRRKRQFISRLMYRVENADKENTAGKLEDPASLEKKWHIGASDTEKKPCDCCSRLEVPTLFH